MNYKIIACRTIEDEVLAVKPVDVACEFLEYALHRIPEKLTRQLQSKISEDRDSNVLLFGYGLCSNGMVNLGSERHTLVVPRVHDCISLLFGSSAVYDRQFAASPDTYYLSKGLIDQAADPYAEYLRHVNKYGEDTANWLVQEEYKNYRRIVFIHTLGHLEPYVRYTEQVARFLKVPFGEWQGSLDLLAGLMHKEWDDRYLVVKPGELIKHRPVLKSNCDKG